MNSYIADQLEKTQAMERTGKLTFFYVEITLRNGECYCGVRAELGPGGLGARSGTQGIWLTRYGCLTFIPGEDVESVCWKQASE